MFRFIFILIKILILQYLYLLIVDVVLGMDIWEVWSRVTEDLFCWWVSMFPALSQWECVRILSLYQFGLLWCWCRRAQSWPDISLICIWCCTLGIFVTLMTPCLCRFSGHHVHVWWINLVIRMHLLYLGLADYFVTTIVTPCSSISCQLRSLIAIRRNRASK